MVRTQTTNGSTTSPKDFSFFFNGVKIGGIGNNGIDNVDYATAIRDDGSGDSGDSIVNPQIYTLVGSTFLISVPLDGDTQ